MDTNNKILDIETSDTTVDIKPSDNIVDINSAETLLDIRINYKMLQIKRLGFSHSSAEHVLKTSILDCKARQRQQYHASPAIVWLHRLLFPNVLLTGSPTDYRDVTLQSISIDVCLFHREDRI